LGAKIKGRGRRQRKTHFIVATAYDLKKEGVQKPSRQRKKVNSQESLKSQKGTSPESFGAAGNEKKPELEFGAELSNFQHKGKGDSPARNTN